MRTMLPALPQAFGNLKEVFRSANQSLAGQANALSLPKVKNSLVILVDGLGWHNVNDFAGHAPFLKKHMDKRSKGYTAFPSTTASSIMSLATGLSPSEHGFIGYKVFDRRTNESVNLLTGLTGETLNSYLRKPNLASTTANIVVVSRPEYLGSGFSMATFGDARFIGEFNLEKRFSIALKEINSGSGKLIYLYIPELDQTAHKFGSRSDKWIHLLEQVDSLARKIVSETAPNRGILLTADHGIIDVKPENHIFLDEAPALKERLLDVGGDPRATFIYLTETADLEKTKSELAIWLGERAGVYEIGELVQSDIYASAVAEVEHVLPDLVILAAEKNACYHRGYSKPASLAMIGQHGGLSEAEIAIPMLRLSGYSSSLLVP